MSSSKPPLQRKQILGLIAMALGVMVVGNDFTAFSVAIPAIEKTFQTDVTTTQWVINGYSLVFGVWIVSGGRMADLYGRRRIFIIGGLIFAGFSLIAGLATNVWLLLIARALMAVGGAMMWPATLGMMYQLVGEERAGLAGGLVLGTAGISNAMGPLLGGVLTDTLGWEWIFYINLPATAIAIGVALWVVDRDAREQPDEGFDFIGVGVLTTALFALLLALDLGTDTGWLAPQILGLFAVTLVGLASFGWIERRAGNNALVPTDVLENRGFFAAGLTTLMMSVIFFAVILFLPQFMTKRLGFSAMEAGIGFLPMMVTFAITSFISGTLYEKLGAKLSVCGGAGFLAAGMFMLSRVAPDTTYDELVPGMVVLGVGVGLFYSSVTTAGITALDPSRASLGGAILYMFQVAGGSIGLGLNTAIVVSAPSLSAGIDRAFLLDGTLAVIGLIVGLAFVGGHLPRPTWHHRRHRHRAHG